MRNSLRYSKGKIEINVSADEYFVTVEVTDDGNGVHEDNLEKIFIPFFRENADRDRQTGGTGLGLAIAKRAVDLHEGTISASNTEEGLKVTLKLPVKA